MICRYTVADRAFHIYKGSADDFGSVTEVTNAPEAFIEKGAIKPESRESWLKMFAAIDRGEPKGKINELGIAMLGGGWRWYSAYFTTVETKDGKPAAAIISFEDITETRLENKNRAFEYSGLFKALSTIYTLAAACNLTKNSYYIMEYDNFANHSAPLEGSFDEFVEIGAETVSEMDREVFKKTFSRKNLMKAFASGKDSVSLEHEQYDDEGKLRRMETIVMRVEDPYDHDILQMTISRVIG